MEAIAVRLGAAAGRFRINLKWVILGACVAVVAYLAVIPLGFLLWQSFFTPHTAAKPTEFTLGNYAAAYSSLETANLFFNPVVFAVGTAAFSLVVGTALAWMNERTNTPFKRLFFGLDERGQPRPGGAADHARPVLAGHLRNFRPRRIALADPKGGTGDS